MGFSFINGMMLLGLAGISLPFLVHLLSRRKFDVVEWGAMQFLELSQKTRRRLRLEELLLLLLRIGLIALIALALARPWLSGGIFSRLVSTQSRDIVFVMDGSYSMGWEGGVETPQSAAIKWAHGFLESLRPGDSIAVIDARDLPREVIDPPVQNFNMVRETLDTLPEPSGSSDLPAAMNRAVQILSRTSNLAREVIVLTDRQQVPWAAADASLWRRFDDLLQQPTVRPRVWVVDAAGEQGPRVNFAVAPLELSRDLSVPDFPVRVQTVVRSFGGAKQQARRVHLEVNGQRVTEKTISCTVPADGEAPVEFEVKLPSTGSWLLSVVLDSDELPGDNRADAAITVADAVPVLIVDGAWSTDPTRRDSFFAQAALSGSENERPWVLARSVASDAFQTSDLKDIQVVILANISSLHAQQAAALKDFVNRGGGLLVAAGDQVDGDSWNTLLYEDGQSLLPGQFVSIEQDRTVELGGVRVVDSSLELPWVRPFRAENDGGFTEARYAKWWRVFPAARGRDEPPDNTEIEVSDATILAKLNTGDPLLLSRQYGKGRVVQMTAPLDADWSTFPTRPDYVAFLHEAVFHLASAEVTRNVPVGAPLVQPIGPNQAIDDYEFTGPAGMRFDAELGGDELRRTARLTDTRLPGVYELRRRDLPADGTGQHFVVRGDSRESDLTPLTDPQVADLEGDTRLAFVNDIDELKRRMFEKESPTELWPTLLLVFVMFLVFELLLTRRLVRGGHVPEQVLPAADAAEAEDHDVEDDFDGEGDEAQEYEDALV